ncbi:SUKH-4 family immunity protein [Streptomyces sp. NPDC001617]
MAISSETREVIQEWLGSRIRSNNLLVISGPAGSGKSDLVREMAASIDGSILVECMGVSADSVAQSIVRDTGGNVVSSGRRWGRDLLRTALQGEHVIFLSNVQWAGVLANSSEPFRIAHTLVSRLTWAPKARIRIALEWDPLLLGDPPRGSASVSLHQHDVADTGQRPPDNGTTSRVVHALALSELPTVDLSVWRFLSAATAPSQEQPTEIELKSIALDSPHLLTVQDLSTTRPRVGFRHPAARRHWLRSHSFSDGQQTRITESLVAHIRRSNSGVPPVATAEVDAYAAKTLPVHAALAGSLERLLSQGWLLARCEAPSLWEGLRLAYPDGVPLGSVAADIRALEAQGVQPGSQGEWVSWLHHAALSSGRVELAQQLVDSGVPLPWRTVWSRWRPSGVFGTYAHEAGRVDELALKEDHTYGPRVVTVRDTTTDKAALPDFSYVTREWAVATGEPVGEATVVQESLDEADWLFDDRAPEGLSAVFATHSPPGWDVEEEGPPPPPRVPASVTHAVFVEGTWILAGSGGLFAVSVDGELDPRPDPWLPEPLVEAHSTLATPELPPRARAAARGESSGRLWLEEGFGAGTCHRLTVSDVPDQLENDAARRFLIDIGLPAVSGFLHLDTDSPPGDVLRQVPWPDTAQNSTPGTEGPFFPLGTWMHSRLLLDGRTGRVLRDTTRGPDTVLAGSSLAQFFTMVRLFDEHRRSFYPSRADRQDHGRILRKWCQEIDPAALEGEVWQIALGPYDFQDSTWDLVSPDGRFP